MTYPEAESFQISVGRCSPMGSSLCSEGVNFAVWAPSAERIELCLFKSNTEEEICRIPLPGKTGNVWHGVVSGIGHGQYYGYRAYGPYSPSDGLYFDGHKLLIDPYAKCLNRVAVWNKRLYKGNSQFMIPKSVVYAKEFDWQGVEAPDINNHDTLLYEAHVRGFTKLHPSIPDIHKGKFLGLAEPEVIQYLKDLGITSLQLMPIASFMTEPWLQEQGLTNYWGYNPINFFAPDVRYANDDPVAECKTMVRELHRAGIEVILDVVFNHTAEAGEDGPMLSFRGLDNVGTYLFAMTEGESRYVDYLNNSGCGNSINLSSPFAMRLVVDALRYWVEEFHIDGFRFDLAVSLAREKGHFDTHSSFLSLVFQDPILSQVKLIAEPWDVGHAGYQLGNFPPEWSECNDKFRDTIRAFWRGDGGLLGEFATRFLGSRDLFHKGKRATSCSVNFVTYHDGFTLEDLVSYERRHNLANLENNRDGHSHNISCNFGVEGKTSNLKIIAARCKQKRNLLASTILAIGTPHLLAGDELSRTQNGNNNAYCQDNEINWLSWELDGHKQQLLNFVRRVIRLRQEFKILTHLSLFDDGYYGHSTRHMVHWHRPDGGFMGEAQWHDIQSHSVCLELFDYRDVDDRGSQRLLILFNGADEEITFNLIKLKKNQQWRFRLDTGFEDGRPRKRCLNDSVLKVQPRTIVVLSREFE